MRILYLSNLRLPTEKAYGIQIAKMCEAIAAIATANSQPPTANKNVKVELIAPYRRNKDIKNDFFEYYGIKRNFKFKIIWSPDFYWPGKLDKVAVGLKSLISALILAFYTLSKKADMIYSRDELILYFLTLAPLFKNKSGIVFESHRFSSKRVLFYKKFNKNGVKAIAISEAVKKDLVNIGYNPNLIFVAPDGVDLEEFDILVSQNEARNRLNLPLDTKIVMYTGHLFDWKGVPSLLEVARSHQLPAISYQPSDINHRILFVFVGGMEYDVRKFKEKTKGLDNVLILGHKLHKDIPLYLKAADVLVLPNSSKEEISSKYTSPMKLFEYMASGRPIVASNLSSIGEILNYENSVLVKPDDPNELARGINQLFNDPVLGDRISKKAREDVEQYTWQKRAWKIVNFIRCD